MVAEKKYRRKNFLTYKETYKNGYGILYPESHVIRFHRHILNYELNIYKGNILDYGCGTGAHLAYFVANGFTPYGCDIIKKAVEQCKKLLPTYAKNFFTIPPVPILRDYFSVDFDIIFSNQVLYFLDDGDLSSLISQFHKILRPSGIIFATMIAPTNNYSRFIEGEKENGLSKVVRRGRINSTIYINFKSKEEILSIFNWHGFDKLHFGSYGEVIREDEGPTDHFIFIGKKRIES